MQIFQFDDLSDEEISVFGFRGELLNTVSPNTGEIEMQNCIFVPKKIKGKTVTEISDFAFSPDGTVDNQCLCSVEHIFLPDTITKIGNSAFTNCVNLQDLYIPKDPLHDNELKIIGNYEWGKPGGVAV